MNRGILELDALFGGLERNDLLEDAAVSRERPTLKVSEQPVHDDPAAALEDFAGWSRVLSRPEQRLRQDILGLMREAWLPIAAESWQAGRFPIEVFRELGRLGAIGASLVGGDDGPMRKRATAAIMHAVEYGDGGLRCALTVHECVIHALARFGTAGQRKQWLGPLCRGEKIASFALTEPQAGSDVRAVATHATRRGDGWIIEGEKGWITNAPQADLVLVWARTDQRNDAIRGFLVEASTPGLEITPIASSAVLRSAPVGRIRLDRVSVPADAVLPHAWGITDVNACLDYNRMTVICGVVGAARFCLEAAIAHACSRQQFGAPIGSKQLVQAKLADMATAVGVGESLVLQLAQRWEEEPIPRFAMSLAKRKTCADALDVARTARAVLGAHGLDFANHVARHLLNLEASYTYGGTDEIHGLVLGKLLTGENAF